MNEVYAGKMADFTEGKREISDGHFKLIFGLMIGLALCNAVLNAFYGAEQATSWGKVALMVCMFFLGDVVLIALAHWFFPNWLTDWFAFASMVGFAFLSIFAAMAFLIGQQQLQENPTITGIDSQIAYNKGLQATYPEDGQRALTKTINALEQQKRDAIAAGKKDGSYMTGATAVYHYLAKVLNVSYEAISITVRLLWSTVFVMGSMALGGLLKTVYSPSQYRRYAKHVTSSECTGLAVAAHHDRAVKGYGNVRTISNEPYQTGDGTVQNDGTASDKSRYIEIKRAIVAGDLKPSVRGIKEAAGSTDIAAQYLRDMADEGFLDKLPNGYKLAVSSVRGA